jgi:hypothetical protein
VRLEIAESKHASENHAAPDIGVPKLFQGFFRSFEKTPPLKIQDASRVVSGIDFDRACSIAQFVATQEINMNSISRLFVCAHSGMSPDDGVRSHQPSRALSKLSPALRCLLAGAVLILGAGAGPALCEEVALLAPSGARTAAVAFDRTAGRPPGISGERRDFKALWRDPAIQNYVGLSEYSWDFNAPGGVPGFGPLNPKQQD